MLTHNRRRDAEHNRKHILQVARAAFAADGPELSCASSPDGQTSERQPSTGFGDEPLPAAFRG